MKSGTSCPSGASAARTEEAAIFISSLMSRARASRAPRKMPGKPSALLTFRPSSAATAPASRASSGHISGTGLAMANTIGPGAIERTISGVTAPATLTPMKTSLSGITSARLPFWFARFVIAAICSLAGFMFSVRPR